MTQFSAANMYYQADNGWLHFFSSVIQTRRDKSIARNIDIAYFIHQVIENWLIVFWASGNTRGDILHG